MVKLQWLQVNKFRSVKPGTRLTFNAGHNVLLGQNGTGKTTLLNLIAAAVKSDFTDFKEEEFELSYSLASDHAEMTVTVRNENQPFASPSEVKSLSAIHSNAFAAMTALSSSTISFAADFVGKSTGRRFKVECDGKSGSVQRADETGPKLTLEAYGPTLWRVIVEGVAEYWSGKGEPNVKDGFTELLSLFTEFATRRFDEALSYFNDLGEGQVVVRQTPKGVVSSPGYTEYNNDGMQERIIARASQEWGADRYVLTDAELPFLKRAVQFLDFESADAILELQNSAKDKEGRVMYLGNLKFYFRHRGGWRVSEKMLSYGQKRMLAFLRYAASTKAIIIADELVNGLHHKWIRACFEMMGQKQIFLTSQNPLLLDYLGFQSVDDVRSTFVLCRWEKESEQMVWENMSQEAAQDFFDSYKVGFQQVGELLQTKGLW